MGVAEVNSDDICTWCENESETILYDPENKVGLKIDRLPVCRTHRPIVEGILFGREEVRNYYIPTWAGNEYSGHMHIHANGNFFSASGKRGFYCAAPVHHNICLDPIPYNNR